VKAELPPLQCAIGVSRYILGNYCAFSEMIAAERDETKIIAIETTYQGQPIRRENVHSIIIDYSDLTSVPNALFYNFGDIYSVLVWRGRLKALKREDFSGASSLSFFEMSSIDIQEIQPQAFCLAENLREISIYNSKVDRISDDAFIGLRNLKSINLRNNGLTSLSAAFFENLPPSLETLNLSENPLDDATRELYAKFLSQ